MNKVLFFLILCSVAASVCAEPVAKGSITLLALSQGADEQEGSVARLTLEIHEGKERVFLRAFPMTKIATQASLRFSQQIACRELDMDCSEYDFLFYIDALPGIVGGPSAGSSATVLLASLLLNKQIPEEIAMTGTINSGGVIGPVGGVKKKIEAASRNGVHTVLIPPGSIELTNSSEAEDLISFGKELNITVLEIATLGEALELLHGIPYKEEVEDLVIDERYQKVMENVAKDLCERNVELLNEVIEFNSSSNYTDLAEKAMSQKAFYSAASFCFRANVEANRQRYLELNLSDSETAQNLDLLQNDAKELKKDFEKKQILTLTDLQTYMAVMERVSETLTGIDEAQKRLEENKSADPMLGYIEERLFSAKTWSRFFNGRDQIVIIDNEHLRNACASKIAEAEERINYVRSIIPDALSNTKEEIAKAYSFSIDKKYIMCLHTATKAKAEAEVLLSLMGVKEESINDLIKLKLERTKNALARAQQKGIFPIIAFSYYEYAKSLLENDRISALLFTEYALELSNIDIYFKQHKPKTNKKPVFKSIKENSIALFVIGILIGTFLTAMIIENRKTLQTPPKRRLRGKKR